MDQLGAIVVGIIITILVCFLCCCCRSKKVRQLFPLISACESDLSSDATIHPV